MTHRALVIGHAHPDFSLGGGELAAYQLFKAFQKIESVEKTWFIGAHGNQGSGVIRLRRENEYLWDQRTGGAKCFMFRAESVRSTLGNFRDLIVEMQPTVIFCHHYTNLGLEHLRVIRDVVPNAKIVLTLHEMLAICNNDGQMVKTGSVNLCVSESPDECNRCFPDSSVESFWLRKRFIQAHFALVDEFVTPSAFLRDRYIQWGLAPEKITVLENGQLQSDPLPSREVKPGEKRGRFAFFGQINPYKGVDILLEALTLIPEEDHKHISLELHGANLEHQSPAFRERIATLRKPLEEAGLLRWIGPYARADLPKRMASVDWLVVPSIWWENSPMVIQEAFMLGRPVVCSDIGGMAEKVKHNVNGWHVPPRNAHAWADAFVALANDSDRWERLRSGIITPPSFAECAAEHLRLISRKPEQGFERKSIKIRSNMGR